jgi:transglutaminase-like putative cysteine protease
MSRTVKPARSAASATRLAAEIGVRPRVLVRVTPGVHAHTHEFIETGTEESKFGFTVSNGVALAAAQRIVASDLLEFGGLHCHIGSQIWVLESFTRAVDVVLDLVAPREGFEADYPDIPWRLLPVVPSQPRAHHAAFERVARAVGLSRQLRPREVVTKLTEYFRSFAPSDDPPPAGADVYLDLALSKKGVCRHRAFAFLVTALNAGIPARFSSASIESFK